MNQPLTVSCASFLLAVLAFLPGACEAGDRHASPQAAPLSPETAHTPKVAPGEPLLANLEAALAYARRTNNTAAEARTLVVIGDTYANSAQPQKSLDYFNQALPLFQKLGDGNGQAIVLERIGIDYISEGQGLKAIEFLKQALSSTRQVGNRTAEATALNLIGACFSKIGEPQKALDYYSQALSAESVIGDRVTQAMTLEKSADAYLALRQPQKALAAYQQANTITHAAGNLRGEAFALNGIGVAYIKMRQRQNALDSLNRAMPIWRELSDHRNEATTLKNIEVAKKLPRLAFDVSLELVAKLFLLFLIVSLSISLLAVLAGYASALFRRREAGTASEIPIRLPGKAAIAAIAFAGMLAIVFSYLLTLFIGAVCILWAIVAIPAGNFILGALALFIGLAIVWALIPRHMKLEPPGVALDLATQPRLLNEVRGVAGKLSQPMPSEVYLIPDCNAWVTEVSGRGRVMALGLPLMQALTISEFRAVLAHEFGHFYTGDTRLGPRVYKTRAAMVRVFQNLGSDSVILKILTRFVIAQLVYLLMVGILSAYWKLFLRVTQLISRRQEKRADELACHIAGSSALIEGLKKMRVTAALLSPYWQSVVTPALAAGYVPPVADGLARFMATPSISRRSSEFISQALQNSKADAYDTHPPLSARIEAARKIGAQGSGLLDLSPATVLLDNLDDLEAALLAKLSPDLNFTNMKRFDWDTAGPAVFMPLWRKQIAEHSSIFAGLTVTSLASVANHIEEISERIPDPKGMLLDREQRNNRVAGMLSNALAVALADHGWQLHLQPGSFYLELGEIRLVPGELIQQLRTGAMKADQWLTLCGKYSLDNINMDGSLAPRSGGDGPSST